MSSNQASSTQSPTATPKRPSRWKLWTAAFAIVVALFAWRVYSYADNMIIGQHAMRCGQYGSAVPFEQRDACHSFAKFSKISCALGDAEICGGFGGVLIRGKLFGKDEGDGVDYLRKGCDGGYQPACEDLARFGH